MNSTTFNRFKTRGLAFLLRRVLGLDSSLKIVDFAVRRHGKRTFLIQAEDGKELSFQDLDREAVAKAKELHDRGLRGGDVLAYRAPNSIGYYVYRLACHRLGLGFMGLPQSLDEEAVAASLSGGGARAYYGEKGLELLPEKGARANQGVSTLNVSSGTTGAHPKIVGLSDRNWVESVYGYIAASEEKLDPATVFLCTLPLATAGSTTFLPSLLGAVTQIIVRENPEPALLAEYVKRYRVNQLYLTPHRLFALAEWCVATGTRFPTLKKIITGTERSPVSRLAEAIDVFGPIIHVGYGMVEALPPLSMLGPRDYRKLGSVGRALGGVEAVIRDGRIAIRTKTVGLGYLNDDEESAAHFVDGWFLSNDYGYFDEEGFLFVLGRKEEVLSETPRCVFAAEVEEALYRVGAVRRCAAMQKDGKIVVFVSLRGEADRAELEVAARAVIDCEIVVVDEVPLSGLGKIDRRALAREIR